MDLVEAGTEDVDVLAEYWFSLANEMEKYDELNELAVDGQADAKSGFERQLDRDDTTVYLLVESGTAIGYLTLRDGTRPSRAHSRYVTIVDLFVEEAHRDCGHGSAAVDAAKRFASASGADYLTVSCEWDNEGARRFYATNGFAEKQVPFAQRLDGGPG